MADSPDGARSSMPAKPAAQPPVEPATPSPLARLTMPTIDRRIAIAGAVLGFGIGLALGLKIAQGMPKAIEVPVPTRTPCRSCAERERRAEAAAREAKANGAPVIPVVGDDPLPDEPRPVVFSPLEGAPSDMVVAAHVPTNADLPLDQA